MLHVWLEKSASTLLLTAQKFNVKSWYAVQLYYVSALYSITVWGKWYRLRVLTNLWELCILKQCTCNIFVDVPVHFADVNTWSKVNAVTMYDVHSVLCFACSDQLGLYNHAYRLAVKCNDKSARITKQCINDKLYNKPQLWRYDAFRGSKSKRRMSSKWYKNKGLGNTNNVC